MTVSSAPCALTCNDVKEKSPMALELLVPLSTEVIEQNPECVTGGAYRDGVLVIDLHALHQDHWQRLGLPRETPIHWGPTYTVEVQELSGLSWPIHYCITTAEGWYEDSQGQRHYFVPVLKGLCLKRNVSHVAMRAGVFLSIIAGIGCRKAAWLLEVLFHVRVGKSSIDRLIDTVAEDLPSADAIVQELHHRQPITEGHFDGYFPRGRKDTCVLVLRDEHGRIVATEEVQTAWYREKLAVLAQTLWKQRYLLFTSDERMSPEEQQQLVEIMETDPKVRKLRTFLHGVWHIFRDSRDAQDAREALEALKRVKIEPKAHSAIQKVLAFLEDHFEQMITYLTHADVQRNSLAESGMRVLRRLEVGHDGLRTPKGRENCLRIYQAVKYLGWSVHNPPTILISVPRETLEGQESGVTLSPVGRGLHMGPVIPFLP